MSLPNKPIFVQLDIDCPYCKKKISKQTEWFDPAKFTDPIKASKKLVTYCPSWSCTKAMGHVIDMKPDQKIEISRTIPYEEIFKPDRVVDYSLKTQEDDSEDTSGGDDLLLGVSSYD